MRRDRERSMSPPRYRQPSPQAFRGRSPPREQGTGDYSSPRRDRRYRARSPLNQRRRTPSPYQLPAHAPDRQPDYRPRSPRYAEDGNAVVFEARNHDEENRVENQAPRAAPGRFSPDFAPDYPDQPIRRQKTVSDRNKQSSSLCHLLSQTSTSLTYSIPGHLAESFSNTQEMPPITTVVHYKLEIPIATPYRVSSKSLNLSLKLKLSRPPKQHNPS